VIGRVTASGTTPPESATARVDTATGSRGRSAPGPFRLAEGRSARAAGDMSLGKEKAATGIERVVGGSPRLQGVPGSAKRLQSEVFSLSLVLVD